MTQKLSDGALQHKREYIAKYKADNYKRIPLEVQLSKYEKLKKAADSVNETVNGFIKTAIDERIDRIDQNQDEK